jgi:AcrR family transcriptional regulator
MMRDKTNKRTVPKDPETTKTRILDAELDVFSNKGYHDATVDDIVSQSDTSKGSVYFHFPNKQTLFLALVDKFADLLERRVTEAIAEQDRGIERVRAALITCLDTFSSYRRLAKIMLVQAVGLGTIFEDKRIEVADRFAMLIKVNLDELVANGEIQPVNTLIVAQIWTGSIYEMVIRWIYLGQPTPDEILETLIPLLLRSIGYHED